MPGTGSNRSRIGEPLPGSPAPAPSHGRTDKQTARGRSAGSARDCPAVPPLTAIVGESRTGVSPTPWRASPKPKDAD